MSFHIRGIDFTAFRPLVGLSDAALRARGTRRVVADAPSAFPERVEMRDAEPGETLLLVNHVHQPAASPYRASHAVYVFEHPRTTFDAVDQIPEVLRRRTISLRAFDDDGMIVCAELCAGERIEASIDALLADASVSYLHAHYATYGCFACRVDRVGP